MTPRSSPLGAMPDPEDAAQYSLGKILGLWAAVTVPMPILAFVVAPEISGGEGVRYGLTLWFLMVGGMIWQFVLSVWILYRELPEFTWAAIRARIWLRMPRDPKTGRSGYRYFWWLVPATLFYAVAELSPLAEMFGRLTLWVAPALARLPVPDLNDLAQPEFIGAWWLMGLAVVSCLFNYLLGEELFFRGILLPRMRGAFGRWDWVANSALFALYHLHRPTQALGFVLGGFALTLPSRYFRSIWFSIILHGLEGIPLLVGVFLVVSGRAF